MKKVKSQSNFFMDEEIEFNDSKRHVIIAAHVHDPNYVGIGHAIYNPDDKYSEELGKKIALGRAKKLSRNTYTIHVSNPLISKRYVVALMKTHVVYLQDNAKELAPFSCRKKKLPLINKTEHQIIESDA